MYLYFLSFLLYYNINDKSLKKYQKIKHTKPSLKRWWEEIKFNQNLCLTFESGQNYELTDFLLALQCQTPYYIIKLTNNKHLHFNFTTTPKTFFQQFTPKYLSNHYKTTNSFAFMTNTYIRNLTWSFNKILFPVKLYKSLLW